MIDFTVYQAITESIKKAFHALEARFLHPQTGLLLNYVSSALPTPQEVSMGKPSHMSWNCPIEDGAYYSGLYLCALSDKKILQVIPEAKKAAIRIACGLISLSETGGVPGFIARNFVGAEKAHYQCGSEDQTFPWFMDCTIFIKAIFPTMCCAPHVTQRSLVLRKRCTLIPIAFLLYSPVRIQGRFFFRRNKQCCKASISSAYDVRSHRRVHMA